MRSHSRQIKTTRGRLHTMAKYDALNMRMDVQTKKKLRALSDAFSVPMSAVVEALIDKAHSNLPEPAPHDRTERPPSN